MHFLPKLVFFSYFMGFLCYDVYFSVFQDNQDAGCGGCPLCPAVDALPNAGGHQLRHRPPLPRHLVHPFLPDVHLHQQRHQPHHLQPHVSEVSRCVQEAL